MLSGKDARPALALEALAALGLAGTTFVPPQLPEEEEGEGEGVGWVSVGVAAVRLANLLLWRREGGEGDGWVEGVLAPEDADESGLGPDGGVEEGDAAQEASSRLLLGLTREKGYRRPRRGHRLLFMAAMLLGWAGRECPAAAAAAVVGGASKRPVPIVQLVVREALKLRGRDAEEVALLHAMLPRFRALVEGAGGGGGGGNVHR